MENLKGRKLKENKRSGVPTPATRALKAPALHVHWKFLQVSFHAVQDRRVDCAIMSPSPIMNLPKNFYALSYRYSTRDAHTCKNVCM